MLQVVAADRGIEVMLVDLTRDRYAIPVIAAVSYELLRFGARVSEEGGGDVPADWAGATH